MRQLKDACVFATQRNEIVELVCAPPSRLAPQAGINSSRNWTKFGLKNSAYFRIPRFSAKERSTDFDTYLYVDLNEISSLEK